MEKSFLHKLSDRIVYAALVIAVYGFFGMSFSSLGEPRSAFEIVFGMFLGIYIIEAYVQLRINEVKDCSVSKRRKSQ